MKKMSVTGVGPYYVVTIILITILSFVFSPNDLPHALDLFCNGIGAVLIMWGVFIWIKAVKQEKIIEAIKQGKLVTSGIYSKTRNPIYCAWLFVVSGITCMNKSYFLFIQIPLYYLILTIAIKLTEEKWCKEIFKNEYIEYCKHVNRIIPIRLNKS